MNIVVLGAGNVGRSIADLLCRAEHSITVVDQDPQRVAAINDQLDVRAICGSASQSSVLFQAGMTSADICLAVTGSDEINIVAASMAKAMGARRTIARVYAPVFRDLSTFDYQRHFNIDRMLSLEQLSAIELARSIRGPGSVVVEQFARGELQVEELVVGQQGKLTQSPVRELGLPSDVRIGTIQREQRMWIATADDQFQVGDRVTMFARPADMVKVKAFFKMADRSGKRIIIGGGGETGLHLARVLESEIFKVTVIERDEQRSQVLANLLDKATVIKGDASGRDFLEELRVGSADVFVACTGDDEVNMMLGVEASDLGAKQVLAMIGKPDYESVLDRLGIDKAVSERSVMAKQIMSYLNEGVILSRAKLPGGLINIIELDVVEGAPVTESAIKDLGLPERCLMVAIVQHEQVRVPGADDKLQPGDSAVVIVEDDVMEKCLMFFQKM
jgi:trk system potassium uptake protein TrkA